MTDPSPPADSGNSVDSEPAQLGPWRRLSSQTVYDNPWIRVDHQQVLTPAGSAGIYGRVHFKNRAVAVIAVDESDCLYLVGQFRYVLNAYSWELPMGGAPLSESPLQAAQRELAEETGLQARQWTQLLQLQLSNSITDEQGFVFLASELQPGRQALEDSESDLTVQRVAVDEAIAMALDGRISDALSVAGLLALQSRRRPIS